MRYLTSPQREGRRGLGGVKRNASALKTGERGEPVAGLWLGQSLRRSYVRGINQWSEKVSQLTKTINKGNNFMHQTLLKDKDYTPTFAYQFNELPIPINIQKLALTTPIPSKAQRTPVTSFLSLYTPQQKIPRGQGTKLIKRKEFKAHIKRTGESKSFLTVFRQQLTRKTGR